MVIPRGFSSSQRLRVRIFHTLQFLLISDITCTNMNIWSKSIVILLYVYIINGIIFSLEVHIEVVLFFHTPATSVSITLRCLLKSSGQARA